jgi:hypothetical protein
MQGTKSRSAAVSSRTIVSYAAKQLRGVSPSQFRAFPAVTVKPSGRTKEKDPPWTRQGEEEDQGLIVLATRKPRVSNRTLMLRLTRTAARTSSLSLRQEPPRATR